MRVLLSTRREERGAVALLVALAAVSMMVVAAFSVDLGQAYVAKRQLQTAADAGALAAAAAFKNVSGSCATVASDPAANAAAQAAAEDARGDNRLSGIQASGTTGDTIEVSCKDPISNVDTGTLHVTYTVAGVTPTYFGKLAGPSSISSSRTATATMDAPTRVSQGLRPLSLCSSTLPASFPSAVVKVPGPSQGSAPPVTGCDGGSNPGNWWFIDCPEDSNNGETVDRIENGCGSSVSVVPDQPAGDPGSYLKSYCTARSPSCLTAAPGASGAAVASAFDTLITNKTQVILPVFCGQPTCNPAGVVNAGGNGAIYPVHRLVGLTVCGYRLNNQIGEIDWTDQANIGVCANNPAHLSAEGAGVKGENYLLAVFHNVQVSGDTKASTCHLGDAACDGGLRRVALTR